MELLFDRTLERCADIAAPNYNFVVAALIVLPVLLFVQIHANQLDYLARYF